MVNSNGYNIAGIVGNLNGSNLEQSFNTGSVVGRAIVGGLVGRLTTNISPTTPTLSNADHPNSRILNSYNLGNISSNGDINSTASFGASVGGIVGWTYRTSGTAELRIENVYNKGTVIAINDTSVGSFGGVGGALVVDTNARGSLFTLKTYFLTVAVSNGRYAGNITSQTDDRKALTSIELNQKASFVNWSFETGNPPVWGIDPNINNGSPYLLWQQNN
jgi:hypothetical protein